MSKIHTLTIPSDPMKLEEVDAFAEEIIKKLPFSQDQRDDIAISISEAVNNAIEHGNAGDMSKEVQIRLEALKDSLKILVTDQGGGFNESEVADPTDPENLLAESGRGLLIIRHLMDEVNVSDANGGTIVELIKKF
jgi:serine/threonine-protein kinase RsbW